MTDLPPKPQLTEPDTDAQDPHSGYPKTTNDIIHLLSCYIDDYLPADVQLPDAFYIAWERQSAKVIDRLVTQRDATNA